MDIVTTSLNWPQGWFSENVKGRGQTSKQTDSKILQIIDKIGLAVDSVKIHILVD